MRWSTLSAILFVLVACGEEAAETGAGTGGATTTSTDASTSSSAASGGSGATGAGGQGGQASPVGSEGCGQAASDPTEQWVERSVTVDGQARTYFVFLPAGYDPMSAYPVVYRFHGCSGNPNRENNNPPVQDASGADAIHIRGRAVNNCWDNGAGSEDVLFFDALVAEVEATWCADEARRFATGYSSGAFMTHRLACERGDVLRGVASIAGGLAGGNCVGQTAALLIHDDTDPTVPIANSESARDRHLENNGCQMTTSPVMPDPCVAYDRGAELPVVWCQTTGNGHGRQDGLAGPAFWGFLSALP